MREWPNEGLLMASKTAIGLTATFDEAEHYELREAGASLAMEIDGEVWMRRHECGRHPDVGQPPRHEVASRVEAVASEHGGPARCGAPSPPGQPLAAGGRRR